MSLPPLIHVTAIRNAVTPAGEWTADARASSTPYVPAAALEAAQDRIAALEEALDGAVEAWDRHNQSGDYMDGDWVKDARAALADQISGSGSKA